jgi:hypothetical protein
VMLVDEVAEFGEGDEVFSFKQIVLHSNSLPESRLIGIVEYYIDHYTMISAPASRFCSGCYNLVPDTWDVLANSISSRHC